MIDLITRRRLGTGAIAVTLLISPVMRVRTGLALNQVAAHSNHLNQAFSLKG
jgi:hypothetical protein